MKTLLYVLLMAVCFIGACAKVTAPVPLTDEERQIRAEQALEQEHHRYCASFLPASQPGEC